MSGQGIFGLQHWTEVLGMPEGERRLTTAEARYRELASQVDPKDYDEGEAYKAAVDRLRNAYDQACRELGNPG